MDMVKGYAALANEGYKITPHLINKIEDMYGNVLYEYKEEKENILNKSIVFITNELLSNTYSNDFIDYTYPTCISIAPKLTKKYAIKSGTTDTDSLVFGYNKDLIVGLWLGYDDNSKTDSNVSNYAKNIWADTIEETLKDKDDNWYDIPKNVVGVLTDPITGKPIKKGEKGSMLYYIKGTEPYKDEDKLDDLIPTIKQ